MHDLISRQAAADIVRFECGEWGGLAKTIIDKLEELPSAQPGWSEQYKNKQSNCKKMPLPKPWEGEPNE